MEITVNGKTVALARPARLPEFLKSRGFAGRNFVIEYNGEILPAESWENVILSPGDRMEIVTFVGGG